MVTAKNLKLAMIVLLVVLIGSALTLQVLYYSLSHSIYYSSDAVDEMDNVDNHQLMNNRIRANRIIEKEPTEKHIYPILDFSIVAFPKCGTTSLTEYLNEQYSTNNLKREHCGIQKPYKPKEIQEYLEREMPRLSLDKGFTKRGIKCPNDLYTDGSLRSYQRHFPEAKLIIGVRHPIRWFESFFNYRIQDEFPMLDPNQLIGKCRKTSNSVCTDKAKFHYWLSRLLLTPMNTADELSLFLEKTNDQYNLFPSFEGLKPWNTEIFFYELGQLNDSNSTRAHIFRKDLTQFVGINQEKEIVHVKTGAIKSNKQRQGIIESKKIDICNSEYSQLRKILLDHAQKSSIWLRQFFLKSHIVVTSSKEFLNYLLETWLVDPCQ